MISWYIQCFYLFSGQSCKIRWSNIRDNYRKSLKKNIASDGLKRKSVKLYKYSEQLSFLTNFFSERETRSSSGDRAGLPGDDAGDASLEHNEKQDGDPGNESQGHAQMLSAPAQATSLRYPAQPKVRKLSLENTNSLRAAPAADTLYLVTGKESASPSLTLTQNPVDAFLAGIAPVLKTLPPRHWHYAKAELFAVVQKYELKMFTEEDSNEKD